MNSKCIGNYISRVREYEEIKQEMLARDANVSRTVLSRIENGVNFGKKAVFERIFRQLGLCLQDYLNNKEWIYEQLEMIYKSIIYGNQKYSDLLQELEGRVRDNVLLTFYPEYEMIHMLVYYKNGENSLFLKCIDKLKESEMLFDDFELAIYKNYLGIKYMESDMFEESLEILNSINLGELPKYICGMTEYLIGYVYHYTLNYYMSARHLEYALAYFVLVHNFNKIIYTQILLSDAFFESGNAQTAIELLSSSLEAAHNVAGKEIIALIQHNISWYSLMAGDYEKSIKYAKSALEYDKTRTDCYFSLVFSFYRLDKKEESLEYVQKLKEIADVDSVDYKMCKAVKKIIKKSKNCIEYLHELYSNIEDKLYPGYKQLLLQFLIIHYQATNNYEKIAKYSLELNKKLSKNPLICAQ